MNKIASTAVTVKKFLVRHKVVIAIAGTAVLCTKVNADGLKQHNDFLKEHGLYEEFYNIPNEQ